MERVLVIDDEAPMRRMLRRVMEPHGLAVETADGPQQALEVLTAHHVDLVLLDLVLGRYSGLGLLTLLRRDHPKVPVIVVSGVKDVAVRVQALHEGAIDVVAKPFDAVELHARVRRHLDDGRAHGEGRFVEGGGLRLDLARRTVESSEGRWTLAEREATLLAHLMRHAGDVCSREELLSAVWGLEFDPGSNLVDVTIRRLRQKVTGLRMESVRGVGYCFLDA